MKATGIVRRIDELGRIVIPKEIRRTLKIREGEPLEIYTEKNGEVIFKKYSPLSEHFTFALEYCECLNKIGGLSVSVFDQDTLVASAGIPKKELQSSSLSDGLEKLMEAGKLYVRRVEDEPKSYAGMPIAVFAPVLSDGDNIGSVFALKYELPSETDIKLVSSAAFMLGREV